MKLKKIDLTKVGEFVTTNTKKGWDYLSENKGTILKGFGAAAGMVITTLCGGTPQINTRNGNVIKFPSIDTQGVLTLNSVQAAISAIEKSAVNNYWTGDKDRAINKILELVPKDADQYTKMYAISALQRIADSTEWSGTKTRALDAITKLV